MIKLYTDSKIYIHCPAGVVTGGAELLHQLGHELNILNIPAYIVYFGNKEHSLPHDYKCYNIKLSENIDDNPHNIEIFYEGIFDKIRQYKNTQKFLWWLSVDHFYIFSYNFLSIKDLWSYNKKVATRSLFKRIVNFLTKKENFLLNPISIKELKELHATNGYQSEYAKDFLKKQGFENIVALKDYINPEHYEKNIIKKTREDIILYNPKKGFEFTKRIIEITPNLKWIPLINMTRSEVIGLMKKAKLYVDFGYHPGKDRLPRECAANGCCIITGMRGSAAYYEDVMIPSKYKFNDQTASIEEIADTINSVLTNYDNIIADFSQYRISIKNEKTDFKNQVKSIFTSKD